MTAVGAMRFALAAAAVAVRLVLPLIVAASVIAAIAAIIALIVHIVMSSGAAACVGTVCEEADLTGSRAVARAGARNDSGRREQHRHQQNFRRMHRLFLQEDGRSGAAVT